MTTTLTAIETEKYASMWAMNGYKDAAPGETYAPVFMDMAKPSIGKFSPTVLDAGCGTGRGALALARLGFKVTMADLTPDGLSDDARALPFHQVCLWHDITTQLPYRWGGKFDWVYCCDVLEHIPPTFTMLVVQRLLDVSKQGLFLAVSTRSDEFGHIVGTPLHQSIQSFKQWRDQLRELADIVECRDVLHSGVYLLRAR